MVEVNTTQRDPTRESRVVATFQFFGLEPFNSRRAAFSFRIRGRTSSRMAIFSKSASQRSGVISG